jgi:hypothetical protein
MAALALFIDDAQPAEPFRLVAAGPQGGIAGPQPAHVAHAPPCFERGRERAVELRGKLHGLPVQLCAEKRSALARDRP